MRTRTVLASLAVVAGLAVPAGAALAEEAPPAGGPPDPAVMCERGQQRLERLQGLSGRLADRIAALEEKVADPELTEEQVARIEARIARLEQHQTKLAERIAGLEAKLAEKCSDTSPPEV